MTVIYLMDPHCGWCFGYHKTITAFYDRAIKGSSIGFEVVTGGLFIPKIEGSPEFADDKRPIAERVQRHFNVEFSTNYFENVLSSSWIDSEPASKAICACNALDQSRSLALSGAIIEAAFTGGRNISLSEVILEIVEAQGFDRGSFSETMDSQRVASALAANLDFASRAGTGFPSVFVRADNHNKFVHLGGADLSAEELADAAGKFA